MATSKAVDTLAQVRPPVSFYDAFNATKLDGLLRWLWSVQLLVVITAFGSSLLRQLLLIAMLAT